MGIKCDLCRYKGGCETYARLELPGGESEACDDIIDCLKFAPSDEYAGDGQATEELKRVAKLREKAARGKTGRERILRYAIECVCTDRNEQYGEPEDSFGEIARLWSWWREENFTPHDVACMMTLLKLARIKGGYFTADSYVDAAGYIACAGEIAADGQNK